jgi:dipeptidyl aminopeptidase/acylaminoacyl peptidase
MGKALMKSTGYFAFAFCGVLASPLLASAATSAPAFQLDDVQKILSLHEPQISPDGKRIAVIVSTPDWKTDKNLQEIDLVDTASGTRRALTWKRTDLSSPRWSADGTRLAFIANDDETKQGQLFAMSMEGGDAIRLTEAKRGVDAFSWSPDGKQIAFITEDEPANEKAIKEHNDAFQVTDNNFLVRAALTPWHLWVVPSAGGAPKQLVVDFSGLLRKLSAGWVWPGKFAAAAFCRTAPLIGARKVLPMPK